MKQEEKATWLQQRLQSRWQRVHGLFESSGCARDEELVSFLRGSFWPKAANQENPLSPHQPANRLASNHLHIAKYPPSILSGRKPKHPRLIPAELRRTLVAHFEGSHHNAFGIRHHQGSGLKQANPRLVLQGAQVGDRLEVTMESRDAH